jgi:hypothetical protein
LEKNFPVAVVTSARGGGRGGDLFEQRRDLGHPVGTESVLVIAQPQDKNLTVALELWHGGASYPRRVTVAAAAFAANVPA